MMDILLEWMSHYGVLLIGVTTLLSCLALPVPSSLMMLTAGGFVASGDMAGWSVAGFAFAGAVAGDQIGYHLGRSFGAPLLSRISRTRRKAKLVQRATDYIRARGTLAVFFSRWLVSPLGPYVNLAGGASDMGWLRFSGASVTGEAVWVGFYIGTGYMFADRIVEVSSLLGNASGALAAGTITILLGIWLRHSLQQARNGRAE
jgi:membrane-associated protein